MHNLFSIYRLAKLDNDRIERWSKLESKVESFLEKSDGRLTEAETIRKYALPNTVRIPMIKKLIETARKECIRNHAEAAWQQSKTEKNFTEFSEEDVSLFLKSDESTMLKNLKTKLKMGRKVPLIYNFVSSRLKAKVTFRFFR